MNRYNISDEQVDRLIQIVQENEIILPLKKTKIIAGLEKLRPKPGQDSLYDRHGIIEWERQRREILREQFLD